MNTFKKTVAVVLLATYIAPSFGLGSVSRACNFADIPEVAKLPGLILFAYLGMPQQYLGTYTLSLQEQQKYWILESITTDYFAFQYLLFAEAQVYRKAGTWYTHANYKSPWTAEIFDGRMTVDSRLAIFNFNRKFYSARAGHPEILQYYSMPTSGDSRDAFFVRGTHYYYDPNAKIMGQIAGSQATDCNLSNLGIEVR